MTYSQTAHAWLRIRELNGTVYWEPSPAGVAGTQQASQSTSAIGSSLTTVRAGFHAETWGSGDPSPGVARFAYLN